MKFGLGIIKCSIFQKTSQNNSDIQIIELDKFTDTSLTQDKANTDVSLNLDKNFRSNYIFKEERMKPLDTESIYSIWQYTNKLCQLV